MFGTEFSLKLGYWKLFQYADRARGGTKGN